MTKQANRSLLNSKEIWSKYGQVTPFVLEKIDKDLQEYLIKFGKLHFLEDYIYPRSSVLELGCGSGYFLYKLSKNKNCNTVGIDILDSSLKTCIGSFDQKGVLADCRNIPFKDCSFDIVISFGLFEHFHNSIDILNEWSRVIKRNGLHICAVPNKYGLFGLSMLQKRIYEKRKGEWKFGYEYRYSPKELRLLFVNNGYEIIKVLTSKITLPFFLKTGLSKYPRILKVFFMRLYILIERIMNNLPFGYHLIIIAKKM